MNHAVCFTNLSLRSSNDWYLCHYLPPQKACLKLFCALNGCNLLLGGGEMRECVRESVVEDFFPTRKLFGMQKEHENIICQAMLI